MEQRKSSELILEEKLVLKTKSASTDDHSEVITKLKDIDELIEKWSND